MSSPTFKNRLAAAVLTLSLVIAALIVSASLSTPRAQALVSYPPAALLQPGDITGAMIRNGAITNANVSTSANIDPTDLNLTALFTFPNGLVSSTPSIIQFPVFPLLPTSTPTGTYQPVTVGYLNANAITVSPSTNNATVGTASSSLTIGSNFGPDTSPLTFTYTGSVASWTVPSDVTGTITVVVNGAQGGPGTSGGITGGPGGTASGTLTLASSSAGTVYWFCVGQQGQGATTTVNNGGTCGGGNAATGTNSGGGGGGMTWFSATSTFATNTVTIVAGGGGGGASGGANPNGIGGGGGGASGSAGTNGSVSSVGGGGGTQSAGGAGGAGANGGGTGTAGTMGQGGNSVTDAGNGGGGGGGGWLGGGGGGSNNGANGAAGGGGGSSGFASNLTTTSTAASTTVGNGTLSLIFTQANQNQATSTLRIGGHVLYGGSSPTVASCGTGASIRGVDSLAVITTGTGTVTACTVNFGQPWANAPICVISDSLTSITPDISSISTTQLVLGFSATLTSGKIYLFCGETPL